MKSQMLIGVFALCICPAVLADESRPNILFILADDQCYETVHAQGNDEIQTPTLDRLAEQGTTFTHCFNMGS